MSFQHINNKKKEEEKEPHNACSFFSPFFKAGKRSTLRMNTPRGVCVLKKIERINKSSEDTDVDIRHVDKLESAKHLLLALLITSSMLVF